MIAQLIHLPLDSQILKACKYLVREIHGRGLQAGDRLMPQVELRQATSFSNDTLSAAMQVLVEAGMLVRQVGRGTTISNPHCQPEGLWTIGLAVQRGIIASIPFYAQLLSLVQEALANAGVRSQIHLQKTRPGPLRHPEGADVDDFHLLKHDLEEQRLDGLLTLANLLHSDCAELRQQGIPVVHIGSWEKAPAGTVIDRYQWVRQATQQFADDGCRSFAVISIAGHHSGDERFWNGHLAGLDHAGLEVDNTRSIYAWEGIDGGQEAGRQILASSYRPDALIIVDDRLAMGVTSAIAEDPDYRPKIAVQTNLQAPCSFALSVIRYEVDAEELVRQGMQILMHSVTHPQTPPEVRWLSPRLRHHEPSKLP